MESSKLRSAHSTGHTVLCYDNSGRFIITGGTNGEVCIWNGIDDDQPMRHKIGQYASAVAFSEGRFFAANHMHLIQGSEFPEGDADLTVARFTLPVTHMCFSEDNKVLVAGSSDFKIKVVTMKDNSFSVAEGHDGPILSVAIDSSGQYLASTSCDGSAKVWKIDEEVSCVQQWDFLPKSPCFSASRTLARLCWMPKTGKQLVIPVGKQLKVFSRHSWEHESTVTHLEIQQTISISAFRPDGELLAASCIDGKVFIWNFSSNDLLYWQEHENQSTICGLAWNPKCNSELAYTDEEGNFGTFMSKSEAENIRRFEDMFAPLSPADADETCPQESLNVNHEDTDNQLFLPDDDEDGDLNHSPSQPFISSVLDDEISNESLDVAAIKAKLVPKIFGIDDEKPTVPEVEKKDNVIIRYTGPEISKPQAAFQSGSTPVDFSHRYMKWNSVGIVHAYDTEEENSIDVEFHDTATHHSLHFANFLNHTLSDVSEQAVVFACGKDEDDPDSASKIVCNHFSSWDSNKEWVIDLSKNEEFVSLCIGKDWIAGATNGRSVRIFTIGGIQRAVLSLPGDIVTVAAHQNLLAITYHKSIAVEGNQNLSLVLHVVGAETQKFSMPFDVPLSSKSEICWLGFSDEGSPCHLDSSGILRMMSGKNGPLWTQVMDTKDHAKGKSDHYFVIGVNEMQRELRCVFCKGSKYPATAPRPSIVLLPLKIPLCELSTEKSKLEENYLKQQLLSNLPEGFFKLTANSEDPDARNDKVEREHLMKMFAFACQVDREFRATEVASLMLPYQYLLQLAIRYATKTSRMSLAERVGEIAETAICGGYKAKGPENNAESSGISNHHVDYTRNLHGEDDAAVEKDDANEIENDECTEQSVIEENPLLAVKPSSYKLLSSSPHSPAVRNPFKMHAGVEKKSSAQSSGMSAFDGVVKSKGSGKKSGAKPVAALNKKSSSKEPKQKKTSFFGETASYKAKKSSLSNGEPKSGFQSWFDENRDSLAKENPNDNDLALTKKAIRIFKNLSEEEKQKWNEPIAARETLQNGLKRKAENGESNTKWTKKLCRQKLTGFMFDK